MENKPGKPSRKPIRKVSVKSRAENNALAERQQLNDVLEALKVTLTQLHKSNKQTSALLDASRAVLKYEKFIDAARAIFESCREVIGATGGYVALLAENKKDNEVLFLESGGRPCTVDPNLPMPVRGLRAEAYLSGKTVYNNDFPNSEWAGLLPAGHVAIDNVLFAPLVIEGKTVGLIGLADKPGGFTQDDAEMATAFGGLASVALQNSRTMDSVQAERDKLTGILDAMEDGVYIVSRNYDIEYANPALKRELGPVEGCKCHSYLHDRETVCPWCNNEEVFAGKTVHREQYLPKTKKTYDLVDTPIKNPDGSVSKMEIFHDITERKRVEHLKDEFIGLVSHELRTPLTVITGSLRTAMSEGLPPEEVRELLQNAIEGADQLAVILENMLELSRYQAGRLTLRVEPVSIAGTARSVIKKLQDQRVSHQFLMDIPKELPPVEADPVRLERILYNLLENATKYSAPGSRIEVSARTEGDFIVSRITDQGPGISPDDQARLFELFQQLGTSQRATSGAGLGLVVCKRLVEAQGGWIKVDSTPGRGSTFSFALPKSAPPS
jgi:signal transduction histidine kinase